MFRQDELVWFVMFPFLSAIIFWFSIYFALLRRVISGRHRRDSAWRAIEWLVKLTPASPRNVFSSVNQKSIKTKDISFQQANSYPLLRHDGFELPSAGNDISQPQREPSSFRSKISTKMKKVEIPTSLRIATRAVVRRAVVVVGGDLARSPRMQYHASSLAQSGLFDEIVLLGLDCGNQLSEKLLMCEQATPSLFPASDDPDEISRAMQRHLQPYPTGGVGDDAGSSLTTAQKGLGGDHDAWKSAEYQQGGSFKPRKWGCLVSSHYLIAPPCPPEFFQFIFPLRSLHWTACTLYRVIVLTVKYLSSLVRSTAIQVNAHGQLVVTNVIFIQTPPAIPFVPLIKYVVRPIVVAYNFLLYYCLIVPASWANPAALREIRAHSRLGTRLHTFWPTLVVDWHNYGYTILESMHRPRVACAVYKWLELQLCVGDVNVTVSQAMKRSLLSQFFRNSSEKVHFKNEIGDKGAAKSVVPQGRTEGDLRNQSYHRSPSSLVEGNVVVLYDVAPSFFAPSNRRIFVEEVLLATVNQQTCSAPQIRNSSEKCANPCMSDTSSFPRDPSQLSCARERVPAEHQEVNPGIWDLNKDVWGIAPPPEWVVQSAFLPNCNDDTPLHGSPNDNVIGCPSHSSCATSLPHHFLEPSVKARQQRGIIMIGSTSWTEDDDYTILIEALQRLDHRLRHVCKYIDSTVEHHEGSVGSSSWRNTPVVTPMEGSTLRFPSGMAEDLNTQTERQKQTFGRSSTANSNSEDISCLPHPFSQIWVLITGKGPARGRFEEAVRAARLSKHITVSTLYFQSYKHYSIALGAADVGLCLHFSSSGLDLPMKGVDMLGCGLPVVALAYPAIGELMGEVAVPADTSLAEHRIPTPNAKYSRVADIEKGGGDGCGLVECERGWIFSSAADLEVLLSFFVGMDKLQYDVSSEIKTAMTAVMNIRSLETKTAKLTPLVEMQKRVRAAAVHRSTWEDNWNQTLGPILSRFI
ncbi:unnamed protein product [Phytomonas sp. EM1]|nr:unnamed protein product [Phytomonas sp. EM1]|eukprot:CCW61262.1 unnamed protein product [Phytomonas sp. isolate EM1]